MSEVHKLPEPWIWVTLGEIGEIVTGNTPKTSEKDNYSEEGIPFVKPPNLIGQGVSTTSEYLTELGSKQARILPVGSVMVSCIGNLGKVGYAIQSCATNQQINSIIFPENISSKYGFYYCLTLENWLSEQSSATTIAIVNKSKFSLAPFPLAPIKEQVRIAETLDELFSEHDAGVKELKAAQIKLTQYRQSLLKSAVEGSLTQKWREANSDKIQETGEQLLTRILTERRERWQQQKRQEFKAKGQKPPKDWQNKYHNPNAFLVENYPREWFSCDLEALIPSDGIGTKTGPFGSLLKKHEHLKSGIPVVGIENIQRMKFVFGTKIHISENKAEQLSDYELKEGDVVISRSGTVGEVCVIPQKLGNARFSTNIMRVRLNNEVIRPEYFCLLFNADPFVLQQIKGLCVGSTREFLNTKILKSIQFILPPIIEQDHILRLLEDEDMRMNCLENDLKLRAIQAEAQRKNILKSAFSGQLVPQDPNDEPASVLLEKIKKQREATAAQLKTATIKKAKTPKVNTRTINQTPLPNALAS